MTQNETTPTTAPKKRRGLPTNRAIERWKTVQTTAQLILRAIGDQPADIALEALALAGKGLQQTTESSQASASGPA